MIIHIEQDYRGQRVYKSFTTQWTQMFLDVLKKSKKDIKNIKRLELSELSIVYIDEAKMKTLNKKYRGFSKSTDVLSFKGDDLFSLGEVLLCQEQMKLKTVNTDLSLKLYTQFIICHSVLHLLGYRHDTVKTEDEMLSMQNLMLKKIAKKLAPKYKNEFDISL